MSILRYRMGSATILVALLLALVWATDASFAAQGGHDAHATDAAHDDAQATDTHDADTHAGDESHGDAHAMTAGEHGGDGEHAGDEHGGEHESHLPHLPSWLDLIIGTLPGGKEGPVGGYLYLFAPTIFGLIIAIIIAIVTQAATRNLTLIPGRLQNFMEVAIGGLNDFVMGILGPEGKRFVPFLGTLFIYILMMNMIGLIPLQMAPTSRIHMTAALAICVFFFVQFTALRMNGLGGYLFHLAGEPRTGAQKAMVPLMFPLHIIGELAKPFSLAVRLFGNVFGEETLIAVFVGLGAAMLAFLPDMIPLGVPIHIPFIFLSILMGTIQALVFMLLSTIYFALVMPHGEHEH